MYDFICINDTEITQLKLVMHTICRVFLPENSLHSFIFKSEALVYLVSVFQAVLCNKDKKDKFTIVKKKSLFFRGLLN